MNSIKIFLALFLVASTVLFADIIGKNGFVPDPKRIVLYNVGFTEEFIKALREVPDGFDPALHCVQIVADKTDYVWQVGGYPMYVEISASGPCPANRQAVDKEKVIVKLRRYWYDRIIPFAARYNSDETLGELKWDSNPEIRKVELSKLCFGENEAKINFAKQCDLILRNQKICDVVVRGDVPRPECK